MKETGRKIAVTNKKTNSLSNHINTGYVRENLDLAITEFYNHKRIYYNRDCYRYIDKKEYRATYFILKQLKDTPCLTKGALFPLVETEFKAWLDSKVDSYKAKDKEYVSTIRNSRNIKWWLRTDRKTKKRRRSYLKERHFGRLIDYLTPLFLNLKTMNCSNPGSAHVISLTKRGQLLYKYWSEQKKRNSKSK